jgi:membrane-bound serine protease (ClpP class)
LIEKIIIVAVAIFLLYELLEHVILPLFGFSFRKKSALKSGPEGLIGQEAEVVQWQGKRGMVRLRGEYWQALGTEVFAIGDTVRIDNLQGLKLMVVSNENMNSE